MENQKATADLFSSKQLLLFGFARHYCGGFLCSGQLDIIITGHIIFIYIPFSYYYTIIPLITIIYMMHTGNDLNEIRIITVVTGFSMW